jgi:hypothetical protein
MPLTSNRELHELLLIEEADAWFEYADATKDQRGSPYAEIEPWAWARLQQRLRIVRSRRSRLSAADQAPATEAA